MTQIVLPELHALAQAALAKSGAHPAMADATARALVYAEGDGLASHGVSRVPFYAGHLKSGRAIGSAQPRIANQRGGTVLVDAGSGLAFSACALGIAECIARAPQYGIACAGIANSHHFGAAAYHLEALADAGLVGLAISNSPAAMPAWGGKRALFGTNPIAAIFPRANGAPLLIDLSLSEVARGKIMMAARDNKPIPQGWAIDADGRPTTDAKAALAGSMLPAGGVKGAMLALIVELLVVALTGSQFGFETASFFEDEGGPTRIGQAFIAIDPGALAGRETYLARVETLLAAMLEDDGVRLPGERRRALRDRAQAHGVDVPEALLAQLRAMAA